MDNVPALTFCPKCGARNQAGATYCSNCGQNLTVAVERSAAVEPPAPVSTPAPAPAPSSAPAQYSADGKWWWNGAQWAPVAAPALAPVLAPAKTKKTRKAGWRTRRLVGLVVTFSLLDGVAFYADPEALSRQVFVAIASAVSAAAAICLLAILSVRFIRGLRSKTWIGVLAAVLALQGVLVFGLNAYADSEIAPSVALIQNYYASVADAVSAGYLVTPGKRTSAAAYDAVATQAGAAFTALTNVSVSYELSGYLSAVQTWALNVEGDAAFAAVGPGHKTVLGGTGAAWGNVGFSPDPFQLTLTTDQADAAYAIGLQQVATLMAFGNRAIAVNDPTAMHAVGGRLDAQEYWLDAIYTSTDPNWITGQFHFIEPIDASHHAPGQTAMAPPEIQLDAFHSVTRIPRHDSRPCSKHSFGCFPKVHGPLHNLWIAVISAPSDHTVGTTSTWPTAVQDLAVIGLTPDARSLGGVGSSPSSELAPPPAFAAKCQAQGGAIGGNIYDRTKSRVPTSEGGWTCLSGQGNRCFDLLTLSGAEFEGAQGGTQGGCPEHGLVPLQYGPLTGFYQQVGSVISGVIPVVAPTWDGTYTIQASPYKCTGNAPGIDTVTQASVIPASGLRVSGNSISLQPFGNIPIDSSGHAQSTYSPGGGITALAKFDFTRTSSGGANVSGDFIIDVAAGAGVTAHCSGPFTGTRD
jgi:zinc-ribbon domain